MELLRQCLPLSAVVPAASRTLGLACLNPIPCSSAVKRLGAGQAMDWGSNGGSKSAVGFWRDPCCGVPCGMLGQSECRERHAASFFTALGGESPVEGLMRENRLCHLEQASRHRNKKFCNNLGAPA